MANTYFSFPQHKTVSFYFLRIFLFSGVFLFLFITWFFLYPKPLASLGTHVQIATPKATVVIDPGHGGRDPGKIGIQGSLEKEINLQIALYLKDLLTAQNIHVILTRTQDTDLAAKDSNFKISDMKERLHQIQSANANAVISIHQNSYTDSQVFGAQCFYYSASEESKILATILQNQIIDSTNQKKIREIKSNNDYYLLKNSTLPTVIVECGFLSNPEEEHLLTSDNYQRKMAWAIHLGILQYLNSVR